MVPALVCIIRSIRPGTKLTVIFYSHIDWHLEAGLAIVFGEAPQDNISGPKAQIITEDWEYVDIYSSLTLLTDFQTRNLCPAYEALEPDLM